MTWRVEYKICYAVGDDRVFCLTLDNRKDMEALIDLINRKYYMILISFEEIPEAKMAGGLKV